MHSNHDTGGGGNLDDKRRHFLSMPGRRNSRKERDWWAPVWRGLFVDAEATHFKKMGNALWLFLYLVLNANRGDGTLARKVRTISADMGVSRRTVFVWLEILRIEGYVETENSGRFLTVKIHKWKPIGEVQESAPQKCKSPGEVQGPAPQECKGMHPRSARVGTSQTLFESRITAWVKENSQPHTAPKKNILKKNILKNDIDDKNFDFKNFEPKTFKTREELLAYDLAKAFKDFPGYPLYLTLARQHPESLLRETAGRVLEVPPDEIKTSRGALFNFLIHQNENQSANGPGR